MATMDQTQQQPVGSNNQQGQGGGKVKNFFSNIGQAFSNFGKAIDTPGFQDVLAQMGAAISPEGTWQKELGQVTSNLIREQQGNQFLVGASRGRLGDTSAVPTDVVAKGTELKAGRENLMLAIGQTLKGDKLSRDLQNQELQVRQELENRAMNIRQQIADLQEKTTLTTEEQQELARLKREHDTTIARMTTPLYAGTPYYTYNRFNNEITKVVDPASLQGGGTSLENLKRGILKDAIARAKQAVAAKGIWALDSLGNVVQSSIDPTKGDPNENYKAALNMELQKSAKAYPEYAEYLANFPIGEIDFTQADPAEAIKGMTGGGPVPADGAFGGTSDSTNVVPTLDSILNQNQ